MKTFLQMSKYLTKCAKPQQEEEYYLERDNARKINMEISSRYIRGVKYQKNLKENKDMSIVLFSGVEVDSPWKVAISYKGSYFSQSSVGKDFQSNHEIFSHFEGR